MRYSVTIRAADESIHVIEPIEAESGDEAAELAHAELEGGSVIGVDAYIDPNAPVEESSEEGGE